MDKNRLTKTSKFLSYVLRHRPDAAGIELDAEGWTDIDALLAGAAAAGTAIDRDLLLEVVDSSDKKRFAVAPDGRRIRAVQGHSSAGAGVEYPPKTPPARLYHGTATRFLDSIRRDGLRPGDRHFVHLSADRDTAVSVGGRHGKPAVLLVDAAAMHRDGLIFHQADNGVWLTQAVPLAYIDFADNGPVV